jgi:3-oxoacyl-[acyl-carrier protein] reductase
MDLGLKGRVALVCAASRGIGRAVATSLSAEGALVAICARDEGALAAAAAEIQAQTGHQVLAVRADLREADQLEALVTQVEQGLGPIEILVNNAGGPPAGGLGTLTDAQWHDAIELGMMAAIRLTRRVLPGMKERQWGRVITIASTTVQQPKEDLLLSSTVRAGVAAFMKALSEGLAKDNVLVHTVCPGPTRTTRMRELARTLAAKKGTSPEIEESGLVADVPMGRMGRPEEVGDLVACLASDRLSYATGLTLTVDGGQVKRL